MTGSRVMTIGGGKIALLTQIKVKKGVLKNSLENTRKFTG